MCFLLFWLVDNAHLMLELPVWTHKLPKGVYTLCSIHIFTISIAFQGRFRQDYTGLPVSAMAVSIWILTISLLLVGVCGQAGSRVPAMFIFGDSLSDPGNNNNLLSLAKANYFPNGIDFAEGVTGRFCNGRTIADFLGMECLNLII